MNAPYSHPRVPLPATRYDPGQGWMRLATLAPVWANCVSAALYECLASKGLLAKLQDHENEYLKAHINKSNTTNARSHG